MARTRGAKDTGNNTGNTTSGSGLTPFADALEQWLFDQSARTRKRWSRRMLAEALDVSYGTVDGWFKYGGTSTRKAHLPEPEAFWALVRVTGWTPEKLRQLVGYEDLPPHVLGPWEFLRERAPGRFSDPGVLAHVMRWIDDVQREYQDLPRRPRTRRRKTLAESVESPGASGEPVPMEPPAPSTAPGTTRRKEPTRENETPPPLAR